MGILRVGRQPGLVYSGRTITTAFPIKAPFLPHLRSPVENRRLAAVYVLKDDLKHLWSYRYPGAARRFFDGWYQRATESRIPPLVRFAKNLAKRLPGILAHCRYPLNTSILEGFNNKIKVIKRMAYGFRDHEYFFLKIRAAFPGNPG